MLVALYGDFGTCYRLGGDEFACISDPIDDDESHSLEDALNERLSVESIDFSHPLMVAIGSEIYRGGGIEPFFKDVDKAMYAHKHFIKMNSAQR